MTSGVKLLTEESSLTSGVEGRTVLVICTETRNTSQTKTYKFMWWPTCWAFFLLGAPCVRRGLTLLLWCAALWFKGAECAWLGPSSKSESRQTQFLHTNYDSLELQTWIAGLPFVKRHFRGVSRLLTKRILKKHQKNVSMRYNCFYFLFTSSMSSELPMLSSDPSLQVLCDLVGWSCV